jgi:hypothetical protein
VPQTTINDADVKIRDIKLSEGVLIVLLAWLLSITMKKIFTIVFPGSK